MLICMTTEADLKRLIDLSVAGAQHEPAFLRALLTATLYVHLPLISSGSNLTVIPAFSDRTKAVAAAQDAVRIGSLRGSDLFKRSMAWRRCTLFKRGLAALKNRQVCSR